jgi:hypothetical protein
MTHRQSGKSGRRFAVELVLIHPNTVLSKYQNHYQSKIMRASLKAQLETVIQKFLDDTAEHEDRPDGYQHPEICQHMANAAEAVYDATHAASSFTETEASE